jgi:putative serine protease PepD
MQSSTGSVSQQRGSHSMGRGRILANLVLAAVLGTAAGWWLWQRPRAEVAPETVTRLRTPVEPGAVATVAPVDSSGAASDEQNNIDVYKTVSPAVVNITSTTIQYDFFFNVFPSQGSGSGFLIDDKGHIVTNFHVISGARAVEVTLADHSRYPATLVGGDRLSDLAVIRIDAKRPLPYVSLGTSDGLQVGQKVLAIGNPFGLEGTLTTGIISSMGRNIRDDNGNVLEEVIQTDAAINPGNSGGPLLNSRGEVIGINTAIFGQTNLGIGFAIPINAAKTIVSDLLTIGRARQTFLGLVGQQITPPLAQVLDLPASQGLLIAQVTRGGPADQAGLRAGRQVVLIGNQQLVIGGDLIVALDGTPVTTPADLARYLRRKRPGDTTRVTLFRGRERMTVEVQLADRGDAG